MYRSITDVSVTADGVVSRRGFFRVLGGLSAGATLAMGWRDLVLARADELQRQRRSMILLWMDGGPSQFECFNPKIGSKNQGPAQAIATRLPGITFAEFWPKTAQVLDKFALIRSMQSNEPEHDRAIVLTRTGYPPDVSIRFPTWGSVVAMDREAADFELPAFVRIGKPRIATRDVDSGVLGDRFASFNIDVPGTLPSDAKARTSSTVLRRRLALSDRLDAEWAKSIDPKAIVDKRDVYHKTASFLLSPRLGVFDLSNEPAWMRDAYGQSAFGQGCLLARRLVEQGTSFVEVISTGGRNDAGWDTHNYGFRDTPYLCAESDPAFATLLCDMEARGLLESTLVVWMGEFGRTPKLKSDGGRDHYTEGWLVGMAGAGVRGGQVIGATDSDGVKITDRPVKVQDLFVTFCHVLGMSPRKEYHTRDDRPIKLVDGGQLIGELFA